MMKKLFCIGLMAWMLPHTMKAQQATFNEVDYSPEQTLFHLNVPVDSIVWLRLYDSAEAEKPFAQIKMSRGVGDECSACYGSDLKGKFYTFDVGRGETPGVFAKAVGVNGRRGAIIDLNETNPTGWERDVRPVLKSPADLVIYELHHRDFSIARSDARHPGKFLALTEPWAIEHLQRLGVNAVHILPSFDYASVDETRPDVPQYNWGYDPLNYNVPEGSYATDAVDPMVRIREFKQMVQALHKAGIRVILDVVYNHTFSIEGSNFQRTYPDYFFRKKADGTYSDGSGCGNETASEQPLMRQFIIESVKYWVNEYHIDGFRFDLMGCHDIQTMNAVREALNEIDSTIIVYGEGWSAGQCALPEEQLAMKAHVAQMPGIAAFSDELRDALRGPFSDDKIPGWLGGVRDSEESIKYGIAGGIAHPQLKMSQVNYAKEPWAAEPTQFISYVSCHDDMCLTDRLRASIPDMAEDELIRLDLLAQTAVFTSQGVPFMLSGEELLRTKQGVHNSYQSPDSINHLDWANATKYPQVLKYYQDLIALRKHHPAFRLGDARLVRQHLEFLDMPAGVVAFRLKDGAGHDEWQNIIVILNARKQASKVNIPRGSYTVVCRSGIIDEQGLGTVKGKKITVDPQSALIIHN